MISQERWSAVAGIRSIDVGDLRVSYVPDGVVGLKPHGWFPELTDGQARELAPHLNEDGQLVASIGGLLVEHGSRAMLIDSGFGPAAHPDDPQNPIIGAVHGRDLLDNLAELGRTPGEIEAVAITHLHTDHIGWAVHGAFPGARIVLAEREWAERDHHADDVTDEMLRALGEQAETARDGQEIFPGVRIRNTFGHTPGHASYVISSGGRRLIVIGDALHSAAQIENPTWRVWADTDRDQAIRTRLDLLRDLAAPETIGFGVHFADVQFGRLAAGTWAPLP